MIFSVNVIAFCLCRKIILTLSATFIDYGLFLLFYWFTNLTFFFNFFLFLLMDSIHSLIPFAFFFSLIFPLFIVKLFKKAYLFPVICGTVGMVLHYILNRIRILEVVFVLSIFKVEALIEQIKVVGATKHKSLCIFKRYTSVKDGNYMCSLI